MKKNEVAHYPEITAFIEAQIKSNFKAYGMDNIDVIWKSGELTTKLKEAVKEYPDKCKCIKSYANKALPLNLDIFGIVTDGNRFEIIILEIKLLKAAGLSEWSQLLGYNMVSNAKFGLLVNINAGASSRLSEILSTDRDASYIVRVKSNGDKIVHQLGFMQWNTLTHNFEYSNLGQLWSLSALSEALIKQFEYN
ncbi:MAG: hypothetical protein ACI38A_07790 [Candidatus Ornithomonoglobus sp.]